MSVVINDFEVVVVPPQQAGEEQPADSAPPPKNQTLTPLKIDYIARRRRRRQLRLRAH